MISKILKIVIFLGFFIINPGPKINDAQVVDNWHPPKETVKQEIVKPEVIETKFVFNIPKKKSHQAFLRSMGFRESTNRYDTINKYGYLGKYQFSERTLKGLGINTEPQLFLKDRDLQEYAMHKYLKLNRKILSNIINRYNDTILYINEREIPDTLILVTHELINDTLLISDTAYAYTTKIIVDTLYLTESGILAAAHLGGAGNVKKFFKELDNNDKYNPKDKFGTSLTDYMLRFSGYSLALR